MRLILTNTFTELPMTTGTVQNTGANVPVELTNVETAQTGITIYPGEKFQFSGQTVYARSAWADESAEIALVPFYNAAGGGGGGGDYTLPTASATVLGGVKVGAGLSINAQTGVLSVKGVKETIENVPSQTGELVYTGSSQQPTWADYDETQLIKGGDVEGTDAGEYTATFTPREGYQWSDKTITAKEVKWTIGRAPITTVPTQNGSLTYNGSARTPEWSNYDSTKLTIGGVYENQTNAGTYAATFTPTANYKWSDGSTTAKEATWTIGKARIAKPVATGTYTYTGEEQELAFTGFDATKMTKGGDYKATNAGDYTATVSLKDTDNYEWDGDSSGGGNLRAAVEYQWTIAKALGSVSLSETTATLDNDTTTATITITRTGDGAITATSSDESVATASVDGTTLTITGVGEGTATVTVNVAEGTNHLAASATVSVTSMVIGYGPLNSYSPDEIQEILDSGVDPETIWDIGDMSAGVELNGPVGALTFSNESYTPFVLGFNHNKDAETEGKNSISFGFSKSEDGKLLAFVDSQYATHGSSAAFRMNLSATTSGGWAQSYMRNTICPAFLNAMSAQWKNVVATITKYTYSSNLSEQIFIMSGYEAGGESADFYQYKSQEKANQEQYAYFAAGNSRASCKHNATTTQSGFHLRSVSTNSNQFMGVWGNGGVTRLTADANCSYGFLPCFAMVATK